MQVKLLELRDKGTHISVIAISLGGQADQRLNPREEAIALHAGFDLYHTRGGDRVIYLSSLYGGKPFEYDTFAWCDRTFATAHNYIKANWDEISSGDLICVETILGERPHPKPTEHYHIAGVAFKPHPIKESIS
jgi:hypothetical protein